MLIFFKLVFFTFGCIGTGSIFLSAFSSKILKFNISSFSICFAAGFAMIGWLLFFLLFFQVSIAAANFILVGGLFFLVASFCQHIKHANTNLNFQKYLNRSYAAPWLFSLCLGLLIVPDLFVSFAPITNADTLAYHLDFAKKFANGQFDFVERAATGAVPLLIQATYGYLYYLGGEDLLLKALLLSKISFFFVVFTVARIVLNQTVSAATALIVITMPAIIYGGMNGDIDVRMGLFVLVSIMFFLRALQTSDTRLLCLAFCFAGFSAGSKYYGLFYIIAIGLPALFLFRWKQLIYASICCFIAGFQWYLWNYIHTSDPVFPMLTVILNSGVWSPAQFQAFKELFVIEQPVPKNIFWFFSYIVNVHLNPLPGFFATRIGPSIAFIVLLPFCVFGLMQERLQLSRKHRLATVMLIVFLIFFALWFFIGSSQRFRYLLPVYPLAFIPVIYFSSCFFKLRNIAFARLMFLPTVVVLFLQFSVLSLTSIPAIDFSLDENYSREDYLSDNVPWFDAISWTNRNLPAGSTLISDIRQFRSLSDHKIFIVQPLLQEIIRVGAHHESEQFFRDVKREEISYFLVRPAFGKRYLNKGKSLSRYNEFLYEQFKLGCLSTVQIVPVNEFGSKTLSFSRGKKSNSTVGIYTFDSNCTNKP